MISKKYAAMTKNTSIIREFAQYAGRRAAEIGAENVYNFTIGNPSVPTRPEFTEAMDHQGNRSCSPSRIQPYTYYPICKTGSC